MCYQPEDMTRMLKGAGFKDMQVFEVPSKLYEELPWLVESGVTHYQVLAFK
jgi:hypothetical protein